MFSSSGAKTIFDWGCFTEEQARKLVPLYIIDEEVDKITSKEESTS